MIQTHASEREWRLSEGALSLKRKAKTQIYRVINLIQTAAVNGPRLVLIEPLSQGDRAFNSTYLAEPMLVRNLAPNMSGERRRHAVT
jgi:hypothetical protein